VLKSWLGCRKYEHLVPGSGRRELGCIYIPSSSLSFVEFRELSTSGISLQLVYSIVYPTLRSIRAELSSAHDQTRKVSSATRTPLLTNYLLSRQTPFPDTINHEHLHI
jgi:hypothetical protein